MTNPDKIPATPEQILTAVRYLKAIPGFTSATTEAEHAVATALRKRKPTLEALRRMTNLAIEHMTKWQGVPALLKLLEQQPAAASRNPDPCCSECSGTGFRIVQVGETEGAEKCSCWAEREPADTVKLAAKYHRNNSSARAQILFELEQRELAARLPDIFPVSRSLPYEAPKWLRNQS